MLINDKRLPAYAGDTNTRPPQGGQIKIAPRRPARRLRRLHGRGLHPQTPGRASPPRHGLKGQWRPPSHLSTKGKRWLSGCCGNFEKSVPCLHGGGVWGGRASPGREPVGKPYMAGGWAGCSRLRLCPPSTGHRLVHGRPGYEAKR